ncbi:MAG: hypothetical protein NW206_20295 [Hyphomonadaceae bacterium]|nr:hypothetical protein [Hyphomonadaceae bacterium]
MAQVLIRNLDDELLAQLKRNAEREGISLEMYLRNTLKQAAQPSRQDVIAEIDALRKTVRPWRPGDQTAEEIVREMRDERTQHHARLHGLDE